MKKGITKKRLLEIENRCKFASPPPWEEGECTSHGLKSVGPVSVKNGCVSITQPDLDFILASRQDIPDLLMEIHRLKKALAEKKERRPNIREIYRS